MNHKNIINFTIHCFIVVIFSVLLVFLMTEIFGAQSIYNFLKDQGSLIAGVIGIIGVIAIIYFQIKTTKTLIESSKKNIIIEQFESEKSNFYISLKYVEKLIDRISTKDWFHYQISSDENNGMIETYNTLQNELTKIIIFLRKNKRNGAFFEFLLEVCVYDKYLFNADTRERNGRTYCYPDDTLAAECFNRANASKIEFCNIHNISNNNTSHLSPKRLEIYNEINKYSALFDMNNLKDPDSLLLETDDLKIIWINMNYIYREFLDEDIRLYI